MKVMIPSVQILTAFDGRSVLRHIEGCGRTCYKSENRITDGSAEAFVRQIIKSGHESVLEHVSITVKFTCDRGISHEIVRHRIAGYSQESTRYCNYTADKFGNEITVIRPVFFNDENIGYQRVPLNERYKIWYESCVNAERAYFALLAAGAKPEEARDVLPTSTKTEVVMTANLREWRHFLKLRTSKAAHPQMREVAELLLIQLQELIPVVFDDIQKPAGWISPLMMCQDCGNSFRSYKPTAVTLDGLICPYCGTNRTMPMKPMHSSWCRRVEQ